MDPILNNLGFSGRGLDEAAMLSRRPYISDSGRFKGQPVITVNTGQLDPQTGVAVYAEQPIPNLSVHSTLRKDEWIRLEDRLIEAARERLTIFEAFRSRGLTFNAGGLGAIVTEWETASEMTDAKVTMDGETQNERDDQEFGLNGVPIPMIHKDFMISERKLLASRQRGSSLDVTTGTEAARSVARSAEMLMINGANVNAPDSQGNQYKLYGMLNFPQRATQTIANWTAGGTTPEMILGDFHAIIKKMETEQRCFGQLDFFIPGSVAYRFREDFKANSDKTLMERVMSEDKVRSITVADKLPNTNIIALEMSDRYADVAMAADFSTVQWQSGSGFTTHFKSYMAFAPRFKADFDGRVGILHGSW